MGSNKITIDVSTDLGKVRTLIRDNRPDDPIFTDEEIETFLGLEGSVRSAAAAAAEALAFELCGAPDINMDRGNFTASRGKNAAYYMNLAVLLRKNDRDIPYSTYQRLADESAEYRIAVAGVDEFDTQDAIGEDD